MQSSTLRYVSSVHLHKLDDLLTSYQICTRELLLTLDRVLTIQLQIAQMQTRNELLSQRTGSVSASFSKAIELNCERKAHLKRDVEATLSSLQAIVNSVDDLYGDIVSIAEQVDQDAASDADGPGIIPNSAVYGFQEWQRAVAIIAEHARLIRIRTEVKATQYAHCPEHQYSELRRAWSSSMTTNDVAMDELASIMIS